MQSVYYDQVACGFNKRYETAYKADGIASNLLDLIRSTRAQKVLEVGCGTGYWLTNLQDHTDLVGIDISHGMLKVFGLRNLILNVF
jgi:ubiquinone/menaquinone biosynthesis C-methylase UbiE